MTAAAVAAVGGIAVAETRVHPRADPELPTQSERVVISFRVRETLDGVYRVEARHRPEEAGCDAQRSRAVRAPRRGRRVRLTLRPPEADGSRRWCLGAYRATVYFKQTVRCPAPVQCGDSVEIPLGSTTFTARSPAG